MKIICPPLSTLTENIPLSLLQSLAQKNRTQIFLIGGALRDFILGRPGMDFDFAVSKSALKLARQFADHIKGSFVILDKEHGCARVIKNRNGETIIYDFADFRDKTLKGDLNHRDFTINALCVDLAALINLLSIDPPPPSNPGREPGVQKRRIKKHLVCNHEELHKNIKFSHFASGECSVEAQHQKLKGEKERAPGKERNFSEVLFDPCGGLKDIRRRAIRMTGAKSFKDDPLRVLRAFSHKAALGFAIEKKTLSRLKEDAFRLCDVAYERKRDELFKILSTPRASMVFKEMDRVKVLPEVIPQVTIMYKVTQGGYHHLDVWPHSLEVMAQLENVLEEFGRDPDLSAYLSEDLGGNHPRSSVMKLAALLHDIGKPQTKKVEADRTSFHGHEKVGKDITRKIAKMLKLSRRERYCLEDLVFWHLRPGYLSNFKKPSERSIFRYFRDTKEESVSVLLLSLADQRSTRGPLTSEQDQRHHEKIVRQLIRRQMDEWKKEPFVRLLDGNDVMKHLKIRPSPLVGKILKDVEEAQKLGKLTTKKEALGFAGVVYSKQSKSKKGVA